MWTNSKPVTFGIDRHGWKVTRPNDPANITFEENFLQDESEDENDDQK